MMDLQDFRRWGHKAADWCADYLATVRERPVRAQVAPGEVFRQLPSEPPARGEPMEAAAITGTRTASTTCGRSENKPGCRPMSIPVKVALEARL
jgi:hypothetical protein